MTGKKKKKQPAQDNRGKMVAFLVFLCAILAAAAVWGAFSAYGKLKKVYNAQCRITDAATQAEIIPGKLIGARIISDHFGITNGANLAEVDFDGLRKRLINDTPVIKDVKISRRHPDGVRIEAVERIPVVRVMGFGPNAAKTYAADREGVIFWYPQRETALLPIIRDANPKSYGSKLSGMALAALKLVEEASAPEFDVLKIQEIDTRKSDYLFATLGDSSRAKIAWEDMEASSGRSRASLTNQLARLSHVLRSKVAAGAKLWNATDWGTPGRIYSDDPTKAD